VLGSSTAEGIVGVSSPSKAWVPRLTAWLSENTQNLSVTNLAKGGFDTYDVMPTGHSAAVDPARNITAALSLNPNIILVNLPTNDVANNIPLATTMANFRTIKSQADARGIPMFITTSQPRNFSNQVDRDLLDTTADSIRAAFGNYVIDVYDELTDFNDGKRTKLIYKYANDNIHLNDSGHYYIFEQTKNKLMAYLNSFELQRSTAFAGPFTTIARTTTTGFSDATLHSGTQYFYRVRTVNLNGTSGWSDVATTNTFNDSIPPTQPGIPIRQSKTMTSFSLTWTPSTDNVSVAGYEIWVNGIMTGTSLYPAFMPSNLNPGTLYSIYVRAYDGQGNFSAPSATLNETTNASTQYYSKSTGLLSDVATWGTSPNGDGTAPSTLFTANGSILNVSNRAATDVGGALTLEGTTSKIILPTGVTLNVNMALDAQIEIQGTGVINLNFAAKTPKLLTLSPASTVNYNYVNDVVFIQQNTYGNLGLFGAGSKTFFSGITPVSGNLTIGTGVGLKGVFGNVSTIDIAGDITFAGTPGSIASENTVTLNMNKNGLQSLTASGIVDLYQINTTPATTVNVLNSGSAATIRLGSPNGGGLQLANGSVFNLGENTLSLIGSSMINSSNQTGKISVNQGQVSIISSSSQSSNLYFDTANNILARLEGKLTGAGGINIQNPVSISDGLKISEGAINSDGNITLLSTLDKTANLEEIENAGEIAGDITVQRFIHAKGRIYRYISSPVAGVTVADWQNYVPITGVFGGASQDAGLGTNPSLFYYGANVWVPYPTTDNTAPIERGVGYAIFVRNTTSATLLQTRGVAYQGEIPFAINPLIEGDTASGWSLLGNPYASTIAWTTDNSQWPRTGISSVISIKQNNADSSGVSQFRYYDALTGTGNLAGGMIAPGQAFWVKSTTSNAALSIRESAKRAAQQFHFREGASVFSKITLTLSQGNKSDPTFVVLTPVGRDILDEGYDGQKRANEGIFNFSSLPVNSTVALAINNSSDSFCHKSIRLNIQNAAAGDYTIAATDIDSFDGVGAVNLVDNLTNTITNLRTTSYTFSITADPVTFGTDRFVLTLDRPELDLSIESTGENLCNTDPSAQIILHKTQAGARYVLLDQQNIPVTEEAIGTGEDITVEIKKQFLLSGENRFRVMTGFAGCSSGYVTKNVTVNYRNPLLPQVPPVIACAGSSAIITVVNQVPSALYNWFGSSGERIKGVSGPHLQTQPVATYTEYEVAMVIDGCEGPRQLAQVYVPIMPVPVVNVAEHELVITNATEGIQWLRDGQPIFNETSPSLRPRSTGNYAVTVTEGGCAITSALIQWTEAVAAEVYPNPGKPEDVHIRYSGTDETPIRVIITDLIGKKHLDSIFDASLMSDGLRLDFKYRLSPGVYFAQITQNGSTRKVRFVLE
jgi:hypothetical protein